MSADPLKLDEKVVFYLENQAQIVEWAGLKKDVRDAAHEFFTSVGSALQMRTSLRDGNVLMMADTEADYPKLLCYLRDWQDSEHRLVAGIGIEWTPQSVFEEAYSGVWLNTSIEKVDECKELKENIRTVGKLEGFQYASSFWPAWRHPSRLIDDYWSEGRLEIFRERLLDRLDEEWNMFREVVDVGVARLKRGATNK